MKKHIYLSLLLGSAILASCSSDPKDITDNTQPVQVTLSNTATTDGLGYVNASGKLVAKNSVNVSTRMMGYITMLKADVGDFVSAGQSLVSINNTDIQAKGGQANAQIAQAQAQPVEECARQLLGVAEAAALRLRPAAWSAPAAEAVGLRLGWER